MIQTPEHENGSDGQRNYTTDADLANQAATLIEFVTWPDMERYQVVGLMSGTSLDGLDIALCEFIRTGEKWEYAIKHAVTEPYPEVWAERLRTFHRLSVEDLIRYHVGYGSFLGTAVRRFLESRNLQADFISSHGHTVFHQPQNGFTFQTGDGAALSVASGLPVVFDFRTSDVARGGQGAPLVPVGDRLLFGDHAYCLNLGGIANISFEQQGSRIAFDVCPCNLLLNRIAQSTGAPYDADGKLSAQGKVDSRLLAQLEAAGYYAISGPRSLGREDVERDFLSLLSESISAADQARTVVEHIALRIAGAVGKHGHSAAASVLVTGGGAWNRTLIERISQTADVRVVVPDKALVDFKEALVFAFLGLLRWRAEVNVFSSVTGAPADHCAGSIVLP